MAAYVSNTGAPKLFRFEGVPVHLSGAGAEMEPDSFYLMTFG